MTTILCTEPGSIYTRLPDADPWDKSRNVWTFTGKQAVAAHPPCGQWGKLRKFARTNDQEKWLGPWCVGIVRENGGVLEHPASSTLWPFMGMAQPGQTDKFGGFTIAAWQSDFGHPCRKPSWFYVVGLHWDKLPEMPLSLIDPPMVIAGRTDRGSGKPILSETLRSHTPERLARWMMEITRRIEIAKVRG